MLRSPDTVPLVSVWRGQPLSPIGRRLRRDYCEAVEQAADFLCRTGIPDDTVHRRLVEVTMEAGELHGLIPNEFARESWAAINGRLIRAIMKQPWPRTRGTRQ
jgi:hypothetical protein